MQKGLVSVVIPNYNYEQFLREAVDNVLSQTYSDIEIIVVDDGSADGSKDVLQSYGGQIATIFQQNHGVAVARINGVKASSGEFVAFLDSDDSWLPEKIEKQVEKLRANEKLGLVHVGVAEIDGDGNTISKRLDGAQGADVWQDLLMFSPNGILGGGSGAMMPRMVFDEVGGFDERLSTSADWDLYFRISSRYSVGFVPEPLLRYRVHSSNMHASIALMEHDMMLAFEKAFNGATPELSKMKSRAYGALHKNLAGSYYVAGNYPAFILQAVKSMANDGRNIAHFLKVPKKRNGA